MQLRIMYLAFFMMAITLHARSQKAEVILQYISEYKEIAMAEMQRTGVPAAIKLAQGIHETSAGTSDLVLRSNNHFGIKCKSNWKGASVSHDDDARGECFRKYDQPGESYRDHSDFLKNGPRYAFLFELDPTDYEGWANGLKKAGYATNPRYPVVLIKLIEDYHLQDYTMIALGKMKAEDIAGNTTVTEETTVSPQQPEKTAAQPVVTATPARILPTYPTGEFRINDTKVIFVKKGTSYFSIAQTYKISLARIFEFNELKEAESAATDHLVYLQRKRKTGNAEFHVVQAGESLWDIAQEQAIRLESLIEYNFLANGLQPAIGEKLYLKNKAVSRPRTLLKNDYTILPSNYDRGTNR